METVNQQLKPIYSLIAKVLRIPESDASKCFAAVQKYEAGDFESSNHIPKMQAKRSVLAWSLMITYAEVPSTFICGMISIFIVIPVFLLAKIIPH
jgi:hypothetical protein